jgi:ribosome-associated protein
LSEEHDVPLEKSKSQRKRDMAALQQLGEAIVALPRAQLLKIPLESPLSEAIFEARTLTDRGAIRRQHQYIGRLMRHTDIAPIEEALKKISRDASRPLRAQTKK